MLALLVVWRILMDYGIAPRVMGHQLEIHPLLAIFTLMVGGAVGGIVGIYLYPYARRRFAGHLSEIRIASSRRDSRQTILLTSPEPRGETSRDGLMAAPLTPF